MPRFSILMPVYNHEKFVAQAIQSVVEQTVQDWELIVINDGSTDRSPEIIENLGHNEPRIRIYHQKNAGVASARNAAARLAQGPWLTYLDSDDVWLPDALGNFQTFLEHHPEAGFIYGHCHRLKNERIIRINAEFQQQSTGTHELFQRIFLSTMCVCHRKEYWRQAGGFDESLAYCEDYDFLLRMSLHCRFEPIGKVVGLRRRHDSNLSDQSGRNQKAEAEVLRRFFEGSGRSLIDPRVARRRLARVYYRAARQFLKEGSFQQSVDMAHQSTYFRFSLRGVTVGLMGRLLLVPGKVRLCLRRRN